MELWYRLGILLDPILGTKDGFKEDILDGVSLSINNGEELGISLKVLLGKKGENRIQKVVKCLKITRLWPNPQHYAMFAYWVSQN